MRKHLHQDFNRIYTFNLQGDVRKDSMTDALAIGEQHTVFGKSAMVGIAVSFFIRNKAITDRKIYYAEVSWKSTRKEKFEALEKAKTAYGLEWREIYPDEDHTWLTEGLIGEFKKNLALGSKETKSDLTKKEGAVFKTYSLGVSTNRDPVVYDFNKDALLDRTRKFCDDYNNEVLRFQQAQKTKKIKDLDNFLHYDKIKWSRNLKREINTRKVSHIR